MPQEQKHLNKHVRQMPIVWKENAPRVQDPQTQQNIVFLQIMSYVRLQAIVNRVDVQSLENVIPMIANDCVIKEELAHAQEQAMDLTHRETARYQCVNNNNQNHNNKTRGCQKHLSFYN